MGYANEESTTGGRTKVERTDCELTVTRSFDAPAHLLFQAWSKPDLFKRWWVPTSAGVNLLSCEMDVRTGGKYCLTFGQDAANSMAFFGKYLEVVPDSRIVWTNDEGEAGAVTMVTFDEQSPGHTLLTFHEFYPTKEALDEAYVGMEAGIPEQLDQLDALVATLGAGADEA
ncbi:MAG: SRPBCC family protein [Sphingomicrobium sp.]